MNKEKVFRLYFDHINGPYDREIEEELFEYEYSHKEVKVVVSKRYFNKVKKLTKQIKRVRQEIAYRGDRLEYHRRELRKNTYQRKILCTKIISSLYRPTGVLGGLT